MPSLFLVDKHLRFRYALVAYAILLSGGRAYGFLYTHFFARTEVKLSIANSGLVGMLYHTAHELPEA